MSKPITFHATFYKASTTVDGGWRVYLDLGAHEGHVVAELAAAQGRSLGVAIVPEEESESYEGDE